MSLAPTTPVLVRTIEVGLLRNGRKDEFAKRRILGGMDDDIISTVQGL